MTAAEKKPRRIPPAMPASLLAEAASLALHDFANPDLLREALTHRSAALGRRRRSGLASNERLEFLGDRVLGLLIAEWLSERFPSEPEGALGPRLATLVSRDTLAVVGTKLGLSKFLTLGIGEENSGVNLRANVVADAVEAVIGALYLDGGLVPARAFVRKYWESMVARQHAPPQDPKSALQGFLQRKGDSVPEYIVLSETGPSHDPCFVVAVRARGKEAQASAGSKRAAERDAAAALLALLK
jgi:ribonuclease-3